MAKIEFQHRVQKAMRGELQPVDEIKAVDVKNPPPLYEIRWQTINVTSVAGGVKKFGNALVRMYHSEPQAVPGYFIGHHIHEKALADDIYVAQDAEIRIAKVFYDSGESTLWGIAPSPSADIESDL